MRFQLEHDWQDNMATPRSRLGERAKIHSFVVLCLIWVFAGLFGHAPWKGYETQSISAIHAVLNGHLLAPLAASEDTLTSPPLYYWTGAILGKLLTPLISLHDASRLINALWMGLTILMIGMTNRELWGIGFGRQAALVFIGSVGLIFNVHTLMPGIATLTGLTMGFYGLALSKRRPFRSAILLGVGLGLSFLSGGVVPLLSLILSALLLPICFEIWQTRRYGLVLALSLCMSLPFLLLWPILLWWQKPEMFAAWINNFHLFQKQNYIFYIKNLSWFAWPALPLAIWGLWKFKYKIWSQAKFQLPIIFFVSTLIITASYAKTNQALLMPFLIPLSTIAAGSIETLRRGAASALNWFGIILFSTLLFLIWLGWSAMLTGYPQKTYERMQFLAQTNESHFNIFILIIAILLTAIWIFSMIKTRITNRSCTTNWSIGLTVCWALLMALWLPWINHKKDFSPLFLSMEKVIQDKTCLTTHNINDAQIDLIDYYLNIKVTREGDRSNCHYLLVYQSHKKDLPPMTENWKLVWSGKQPGDKNNYKLFYKE
ncbi:MAG: ArnT family glycosyltransferase [Candidatus Methylopumilus sp.]